MKRPASKTPFLVLLLVTSVLLAASQAKEVIPPNSVNHEKVFNLELNAGFLSAGLQKAYRLRGDEIRFGPVVWLSETYGAGMAEMWGVTSRVTFETDTDRKTLINIRIDPVVRETRESPWNLWRHRHGYQFFYGKGYVWNSVGDFRPVLDPVAGAFYDQYLRNVWGYWVRHRLSDYLGSGDTNKGADWSSMSINPAEVTKMEKPIKLRYSKEGLLGSYPVLFQINLWSVPVKIDFEIVRSTNPHSGSLIQIARKYRWRYDMAEWRRRHGYERTFLGDYEWVKDFPEGRNLSKNDGFILDGLLEQGVAIWVEAGIEQVMATLNQQFAVAVEALPSP